MSNDWREAFDPDELEQERRKAAEQHLRQKPKHKPNRFDRSAIIELLSGTNWLARDIPKPDFLLGEMLSTTCRAELVGPTGLGKTNFLLAKAFAVADGNDFLHWKGGGKPRRVLFIDGEMSRRLAKERLEDANRRHGGMPKTLFYFNREDFPDFEPLNTDAGQKYIDHLIEQLGGVDLIILDNVQALLIGDMKDEESWQDTLPWVRDLTRRAIGQIWAHHTGHEETHGYGTKTREWQLDTVILLERVEQPGTDIAFQMKFTKARERRPDNRADFETTLITLAEDTWSSERGGHLRSTTRRSAADQMFDLLKEAIVREGVIPPANSHIPPDTRCVKEILWRAYCDKGLITSGEERPEKEAEAKRGAYRRGAQKLVGTKVGKWDPWVWIVK
jgi:hypothetical protein